jgi:hypothetical protein
MTSKWFYVQDTGTYASREYATSLVPLVRNDTNQMHVQRITEVLRPTAPGGAPIPPLPAREWPLRKKPGGPGRQFGGGSSSTNGSPGVGLRHPARQRAEVDTGQGANFRVGWVRLNPA